MPWTPIAVRAWRTSSSLKGLMIATTSFMGSGLHFIEHLAVCLPGDGCRYKSGIFLCKWHKKVADFAENISGEASRRLYRRQEPPSEYHFARRGILIARLPSPPAARQETAEGTSCRTDPGFMPPTASNRA